MVQFHLVKFIILEILSLCRLKLSKLTTSLEVKPSFSTTSRSPVRNLEKEHTKTRKASKTSWKALALKSRCAKTLLTPKSKTRWSKLPPSLGKKEMSSSSVSWPTASMVEVWWPRMAITSSKSWKTFWPTAKTWMASQRSSLFKHAKETQNLSPTKIQTLRGRLVSWVKLKSKFRHFNKIKSFGFLCSSRLKGSYSMWLHWPALSSCGTSRCHHLIRISLWLGQQFRDFSLLDTKN